MLDFESFKDHVSEHIKEFLPEEFEYADISFQTVRKNNGKELTGLTIKTDGCNIFPNIYLEQYYEDYAEHGMELDVCMEQIAKTELLHMDPPEEIRSVTEKFHDIDFIKSHVVISIVNAAKNEEMLKESPHKLTEDLAIIYKIYLGGNGDGVGTIRVKNEHMKQWGLSLEELHECAMENSNRIMPAKVQDMGSIMREMIGDAADTLIPEAPEDEMMYVISNDQKVGGAASIIYSDALERLSEKLGKDLYILPSSVHETIAVPADLNSPEELARMVKEVNATQVSLEEQLSDHVYKYDSLSKTLSIADTEGEEISMVSEKENTYEAGEASRPRHHR